MMAVEIIKRGELKQNRKREWTCRECDTKFKFLESDAERIGDQRDGAALKVPCPLCKTMCWIGL